MEFSIIIPAYNIEKYIARTLDSILSQKLPLDQFEIIRSEERLVGKEC